MGYRIIRHNFISNAAITSSSILVNKVCEAAQRMPAPDRDILNILACKMSELVRRHRNIIVYYNMFASTTYAY